MFRQSIAALTTNVLLFSCLMVAARSLPAELASRNLPNAMAWPTDIAVGGDCNDLNADVSPNHPEVQGNGIDDDCDGLADEAANGEPSGDNTDADSDGQSLAEGDCNDTNAAVRQGIAEIPGNLIDDNCNGLADEDAQGHASTDAADHDNDGVTIAPDSIFWSGFDPFM